MATFHDGSIRTQLLHRQERPKEFLNEERKTPQLVKLLHEVDSALERLNDGSYGICEVCRESIEPEYLRVEPLVRICLGHLSEEQQRAVERDLHAMFRTFLASDLALNKLVERANRLFCESTLSANERRHSGGQSSQLVRNSRERHGSREEIL